MNGINVPLPYLGTFVVVAEHFKNVSALIIFGLNRVWGEGGGNNISPPCSNSALREVVVDYNPVVKNCAVDKTMKSLRENLFV